MLGRYWVAHLHIGAFNLARIGLGDCGAEIADDWFRPAYISFCISQESVYRNELDLPQVIAGDTPELLASMPSTWMDRAEEGHRDLRRVWEESWERAFGMPSPYKGLQL